MPSRKDCLKMCAVIHIYKQYSVSLLSVTDGLSTHLRVWPFGSGINTSDFWRDQHIVWNTFFLVLPGASVCFKQSACWIIEHHLQPFAPHSFLMLEMRNLLPTISETDTPTFTPTLSSELCVCRSFSFFTPLLPSLFMLHSWMQHLDCLQGGSVQKRVSLSQF